MSRAPAPGGLPQGQQWPEEAEVGIGGPEDLLDSSEEDEVPPLLEIPDGPPNDATAQHLAENNKKLRSLVKRVEQRKKKYQTLLKAYQRKEMEFVAQMDTHMDEVEHTEHTLSMKIENLSAENSQLRSFNEKRERENAQLAERLAETTKQCSESETRVQFLVDRIVALLSTGSTDTAQTDAVVAMRQREREMLRQLEETRQQFDEVRQQNGELHSRLTEELGLSRRLQDQLVEVEERFNALHHHRATGGETPGGGFDGGLAGGGGVGDVALPLRANRLGPRPMGLRSDPTETTRDLVERGPLPELPPPISEVGEVQLDLPPLGADGGLGSGEPPRCSTPLNPVLEAEISPNPEDGEFEPMAGDGFIDQGLLQELQGFVLEVGGDAGATGETDGDVDGGLSPEVGPPPPAAPMPVAAPQSLSGERRPHYSRTTASAESLMLMEQRLREALDRASFESAVVRVESGIYNFGPTVRAVVELTADNEVVATHWPCDNDSPWEPIDDFIHNITASRHSLPQLTTASSTSSVVPLANESASGSVEIGPAAVEPGPGMGASVAPELASQPPEMPMQATRVLTTPSLVTTSATATPQTSFTAPLPTGAPAVAPVPATVLGPTGALGGSMRAPGAPMSGRGPGAASPQRVAGAAAPAGGAIAAAPTMQAFAGTATGVRAASPRGEAGGSFEIKAGGPLISKQPLLSGSTAPAAGVGTATGSTSGNTVTAVGRQSVASTPERLRTPGQPSPGYPGGPSQGATLPSSGQQAAGGQRVLVAPSSAGGVVRYGIAPTMSQTAGRPATAGTGYPLQSSVS